MTTDPVRWSDRAIEFSAFVAKRNPFRRLEVCKPHELTESERASIPPRWLDIVGQDGRDGVAAALEAWQDHIPDRLSGLQVDISDRGVGVFLGRADAGGDDPPLFTLVYALSPPEFSSRPFDACFGYPPVAASALEARFPELSSGIGIFNAGVHDGFRHAFGGILPVQSFVTLAETRQPSDFEVLDTNLRAIPLDAHPNLQNLVVVAGEGGSHGTCVDISTEDLDTWEFSDRDGLLEHSYHPDHWTSIDALLMRVVGSTSELYERMGYAPQRSY